MEAAAPSRSGDYFPAPPTKRKDVYGKWDVTTPKHLIDLEDNYVAVITTGENRHPNENEMIEHYARQLAGQKDGTWDPVEDPPIVLRDLLPTVFVVINKVFTQHEVLAGGGDKVVRDYILKLKNFVDFDILAVQCSKPCILPLHPLIPKEHRDPVYQAAMESYYKKHDEDAQEIINRMLKARKDSEKAHAEAKLKAEEEAKQKTLLDARSQTQTPAASLPPPNEEDDK